MPCHVVNASISCVWQSPAYDTSVYIVRKTITYILTARWCAVWGLPVKKGTARALRAARGERGPAAAAEFTAAVAGGLGSVVGVMVPASDAVAAAIVSVSLSLVPMGACACACVVNSSSRVWLLGWSATSAVLCSSASRRGAACRSSLCVVVLLDTGSVVVSLGRSGGSLGRGLD